MCCRKGENRTKLIQQFYSPNIFIANNLKENKGREAGIAF